MSRLNEAVPAGKWSEVEIKSAIRWAKNKKAPGGDMLEAEIIKASFREGMTPVYEKLFNACIEYEVYFVLWKETVVRVLFKVQEKDKVT